MEFNPRNWSPRQRIYGGLALGASVVALVAGAKMASTSADTPHSLGDYPTCPQKARPGDGLDDLSLRVNSGADIYSNGMVMPLRQFLRDELERREGRPQLQVGDELDVPHLSDEKCPPAGPQPSVPE